MCEGKEQDERAFPTSHLHTWALLSAWNGPALPMVSCRVPLARSGRGGGITRTGVAPTVVLKQGHARREARNGEEARARRTGVRGCADEMQESETRSWAGAHPSFADVQARLWCRSVCLRAPFRRCVCACARLPGDEMRCEDGAREEEPRESVLEWLGAVFAWGARRELFEFGV